MKKLFSVLGLCLLASASQAQTFGPFGPGPRPGISQLTGDCSAGPGGGSQAVTCTKYQGQSLVLSVTSATVSAEGGAASHSYVPNDTVTLTGGTETTNAVLTVTHTQLSSVNSIAAGGTGCTNGSGKILTGTTGTGTKFQVSATVAGNTVTSIDSISVNGDYTANPSSLTAEPVTGDSCTGTQLSINIGVLTATVTTPGAYTIVPTNPVSQGSSSGSGTGATWTLTFSQAPLAANPTATAGPTAINGSSNQYMRADAAPAVQQGTNAQKGVIQVDGTTITASSGVISTAATTVAGATCTPGSSCGLTSLTTSLSGSNVALNNTANYFSAGQVAQGTSGTWVACANATIADTSTTAIFNFRLSDGTTVFSSGRTQLGQTNIPTQVSLCGIITSPASNIRLEVRDTSSTAGLIIWNDSGNNHDTTLTVWRIN